MTHIKQYYWSDLENQMIEYIIRRPYHKPYNRLEQKRNFKFELTEFEKLVQTEYETSKPKTN